MKSTSILSTAARFKRVAVGISGGVDSAVAAHFLKLRGFDVVGVFMRNWDRQVEAANCQEDKDLEDAHFTCRQLGIPLKEVNFVKEYWVDVFSYFLDSYRAGRTPNPDIMCNRHIKFDAFFKFAQSSLTADAIATGHYAGNSFGDYLEDYAEDRNAKLLRPFDKAKDQTLFLSRIPQASLRKTMFPLSSLQKRRVKEIATEIGLKKIAQKEESVGICFVGKRHFKSFIDEFIDSTPGDFVCLETGVRLGRHEGLHRYTIGQRINRGGLDACYYVVSKDLKTQDITVCSGNKHPSLFRDSLIADCAFWISGRMPRLLECSSVAAPFRCEMRWQHAWPEVGCEVTRLQSDGDELSDRLYVKVDKHQRALTCGQFCVFYDGRECLGSAEISAVGPSLYDIAVGNKILDKQNDLHRNDSDQIAFL